MIRTTQKLFNLMDPALRIRIGLLILPMLCIMLLEVLSIGMILPVIQVLLQGDSSGNLSQILLAYLPSPAKEEPATWIIGAFAAVFVIKNIAILAMMYTINRTVQMGAASLLSQMHALYLARSMTFHYRHNSALLLRNLTSGSWQTFDAVRIVLFTTLEILLMVAATVVMLLVEPVITLATAVLLGAIGTSFYLIAGPRFRHWGERSMALEGNLIKWIIQSLSGIRDIKLLHAGRYMESKVAKYARARAEFMSLSATASQIPRLLIETTVVIGFLVIVAALLAMKETSAEVMTVLGLYGMAGLRLMPSLNRTLTSLTEIRHRTAFIDTVHRDMKEGRAEIPHQRSPGAAIIGPLVRNIRLASVSYAYESADHHALRDVNLTISKGESVGIVGSSGAGKSTLIDIVLGLISPETGMLLIDGIDACEDLSGWQRQIGYVPQQINLFDDTLRRNIAFGIDDDKIDDSRINQVMDMARLTDLVAELPDGLDTVVGERGVRLSGGQRQRVAIGRALYHDPAVLVFDEATAALDNETEKEITLTIESLLGNKTMLIIAHRISTVNRCDQIVFMKDGRVEAVGSFEHLLKTNPEFRKMAQIGEFSGDSIAWAKSPELDDSQSNLFGKS